MNVTKTWFLLLFFFFFCFYFYLDLLLYYSNYYFFISYLYSSVSRCGLFRYVEKILAWLPRLAFHGEVRSSPFRKAFTISTAVYHPVPSLGVVWFCNSSLQWHQLMKSILLLSTIAKGPNSAVVRLCV